MSTHTTIQALWTVFQHTGNPMLLAVPAIARDEERHWVLAQRPQYLTKQAAKHGLDSLVKSLWSRLEGHHQKLQEECIRTSNLEMMKSLDRASLSPKSSCYVWDPFQKMRRQVSSMVDLACCQGNEAVILWVLEHTASNDDYQTCVEQAVFWDMPNLVEKVLSKSFYTRNALMHCISLKRDTILAILLRHGVPLYKDFYRQIGIYGSCVAWKLFNTFQIRPSFTDCMLAFYEAAHRGHAKLCHLILTTLKTLQPDVNVRDQYLPGRTSDMPTVEGCISNGHLRCAKVLLKHGLPLDLEEDFVFLALRFTPKSLTFVLKHFRPSPQKLKDAIVACERNADSFECLNILKRL